MFYLWYNGIRKKFGGGHLKMSYSIESERLLLRPFKLADAEEYFQMTSDATIRHYIPNCWKKTIEKTRDLISTYYLHGDFSRDFYIIIEDKISHEIIGAIIAVATRTKPLDLDISFLIKAEKRKQGYMYEALEAFMRSVPKPAYLTFMIKEDNIASLNTISKFPIVREYKISGKPYENERFFVIEHK